MISVPTPVMVEMEQKDSGDIVLNLADAPEGRELEATGSRVGEAIREFKKKYKATV